VITFFSSQKFVRICFSPALKVAYISLPWSQDKEEYLKIYVSESFSLKKAFQIAESPVPSFKKLRLNSCFGKGLCQGI